MTIGKGLRELQLLIKLDFFGFHIKLLTKSAPNIERSELVFEKWFPFKIPEIIHLWY